VEGDNKGKKKREKEKKNCRVPKVSWLKDYSPDYLIRKPDLGW
jgi:hypothetical protein